jgi:hypothetical protein
VTLEDGRQTVPQNVLLHEKFEQLFTVERDHGYSLEIGAVEIVVGGDVELAQLERDVSANTREDGASVIAEVTIGL